MKFKTERQRGGVAFVEQWTNARAGLIGFLTGRGNSSEAIAEALGDGTSPATIRRMWKLWRLEDAGHRGDDPVMIIPISTRDRAHLAGAAARAGMPLDVYCEQILLKAIRR